VKGGLAAGGLFGLPGALVMLGLSIFYALATGLGWFAALFLGIKAAVLAIVAQALFRIAGRALDTPLKKILAIAAFFALAVFNLPFPLVVLGAGAIGFAVAALKPDLLGLKPPSPDAAQVVRGGGVAETLKTIAVWLVIWGAPMLVIFLSLGTDHVLWKIGSFFSQLAVVTFGGAYAVLAYMAQEAVQGFGWLQPGEMADGLGLAESTPGPLIMVTQFVGFLAAYRAPDPFSPMVAGIIGAGLTTWVTFAPCFLWIFTFAPWIERLRHATRLKGGLAAITASVVGVIANLTLWFALNVLFTRMTDAGVGSVRLPDMTSLDWRAAVLAGIAGLLLFQLKWGVLRVLAVCAAGGLALSLV
jgi:chromate transporter